MNIQQGAIRLSATDVANHLSCGHLTSLNLQLARREIPEPVFDNPHAYVLQQRGREHERDYVASLRERGFSIADLSQEEGASALERTLAAMRRGDGAIVQATLQRGDWYGRADVLLRVERDDNKSHLGAWSYEAVDCKLSRETKAETVLQLCMYSELLADLQGVEPEHFYVIRPETGLEPEKFRFAAYAAYYRLVQKKLSESVARDARESYPEPVGHCDVCKWWKSCEDRRRKDDHLSFVAGTSRLQRIELERQAIVTLAGLGRLPLPIPFRPSHGAKESYQRIREQARIQLAAREERRRKYEWIGLDAGKGLFRLPEPNEGDVYFDLEGDLFVEGAGIEYLFGVAYRYKGELKYWGKWASNRTEEREAYEELLRWFIARLGHFPDLHIYHFDDYEPSALKRLAQRYAMGGEQLDQLLRGQTFVDLHQIVRQSIRASVEQYSLKALEPFYGYEREIELAKVGPAKRFVEHQLELYASPEWAPEIESVVEGYNRDDCRSLERLQVWLEQVRTAAVADGHAIERPERPAKEASENVTAHQAQVAAMFERLTANIPAEPDERNAEEGAHWLLAHALDWHAREDKVKWWEFFRMKDMAEEELAQAKKALTGLAHCERLAKVGKERNVRDRYAFPDQECAIRVGDKLFSLDTADLGEVMAIDLQARTIDVKKNGARTDDHPDAAFAHLYINPKPMYESLYRLAESVVADGVAGERCPARDLLLRRAPKLVDGHTLVPREGEAALDTACRVAAALDGSMLPVQGPPGSGKTYAGARMICTLIRQGRKVGVTATGHAVIHKLLLDAAGAACDPVHKANVRCGHKDDGWNDGVAPFGSNEAAAAALADGTVNVLGGTPWMWARPEFARSVDVLFVDEAGQMSLANVLACAQAGVSLVLLGDPQQLNQVQQGTHPEGSGVSALEHLLGGRATIGERQGLFLPETRRLHPAICDFTSELFYEGRLQAHGSTGQQRLESERFGGAGLWYLPVRHEGNQSGSDEEVRVVAGVVDLLRRPGNFWVNQRGERKPITLGDVLIVAPYNDQVRLIEEAIPDARVGTVDKFQGQEAAVVIYSMTTSTPEDAPRGMEFLYDPHRFNVATSRARCACIVVGDERLFSPDCRTPRQIELANVLCRYAELATRVTLELTA